MKRAVDKYSSVKLLKPEKEPSGYKMTQFGDKVVVLLIEALKNYKSQKRPMDFIIKVEFKNTVVKESNRLPAPEDGPLLINLEHTFRWNTTRPEELDDLFAYPIVFSVYETAPKSSAKEKKRAPSEEKLNTVGHCTLDLLPMITEMRTNYREDLVIQQESNVFGHEIITWPNLPRLAVQLSTAEPLMTREELENSNIALLTLEGVYNIPCSILDALTYSAGVSIQLQPRQYKDIIFDGGAVTTRRNTDISKRWCHMFAQHGKAIFTNYPSSMDYDLANVNNELDVNLYEVTSQDTPRIEWNKTRRTLLMNHTKSPFLLGLADKNSVLPIEVLVMPRKVEPEKTKSRKEKDKDKEKEKEKEKDKDVIETPLHLITYVKFKDFFQPGCLKSRVCGQLCYFDFNDFKLKSARSKFVFETRVEATSSREKKKPTSSRSTRFMFQVDEKVVEPVDSMRNVPLINDYGEPMIIIFEIELFKPIFFPESQLRKLEESELEPISGISSQESILHMSQEGSDEEEGMPTKKSPYQNKRGLVKRRLRDKNIQLPEVICKKQPLEKNLSEQDESYQEKQTLIRGLTEKFFTAKDITPKELCPIEPPNLNMENDDIIMNMLSNVPQSFIDKLHQKGIKFKKPKFKDIVLDVLLPRHEMIRISSLTNLLDKSQSFQSPIEELTQSINGLINLILDQYIQFLDLEDQNKDRIVYPQHKADDDRIAEFFLHLQSIGLYNGIREKLQDKIYRVFNENSDKIKEQKITRKRAYTTLLDEIHLHINSLHPNNYDYQEPEICYQQLYLAMEAEEEGDFDKAKAVYIERLSTYGDVNHEVWLEYVIYNLNRVDLGMAVESAKEAIMMERRDKMALLIYGVLLCHYKCFIDANYFLEAATCFYPRCMECWMVLHLFYLLILNYTKAEWALNMAYKLYDGIIDPDPLNFPLLSMDQLFWSPIPNPHDNIFLTSARFLIKMRMKELAEMALAQHMDISGPSVPYAYYLSVNHYIAERYRDALSHLEECSPKEDQKYCIWSLMGHCHYKLREMDKAMEYYKKIMSLEDLPPDMHLVSIRLGNCYMNSNEFEEAQDILYAVSLVSPSTMTWCYLGIAFYEQKKYLEAEMAFSEALRLCSCPIVWAYLALINIQNSRECEYEECFKQAIKLKLNDCLRNRIIHIRDVKIILDSWNEGVHQRILMK